MGDKYWFPITYSRDAAVRMNPDQYADAWETPHINALRANMEKEAVKLNKVRLELGKEMNALNRKHKKELAAIRARGVKGGKKAPTDKSHLEVPPKEKTLTLRDAGKKHTVERNALKQLHKKKLDAPDNKLFDQSQKDEGLNGRIAIRDKYKGMRSRLIKSPDGMIEESGIPMVNGDTFEVSKGRTIPVPTEHKPRELLGENPSMTLEAMVNRQEALLTVYEDSRFGQVDFKNIFDGIDEEYAARNAVLLEKNASNRAISKLKNQYAKAVKDTRLTVKSFYDIREPIEHQGLRDIGTAMKAVISMQKLGSVMLSTTPEIAAGLSSVGMQGWASHYISHAFAPSAMYK